MGTGLRAGAASVDITPFVGGPMAGYGARVKGSETIDDALYSKALVLDDGTVRMALIANDLIGVDVSLVERVRWLVEGEIGIPREHVLICGTHTHFGPGVQTPSELEDPFNQAYREVLIRKMVTAVQLANDGLRAARIGASTGKAEGVSFNRRLLRPDGTVQTVYMLPLPDPALQFQSVDPEVRVLRVDDREGCPIASVVNFACHPVSSSRDRFYAITADYPGYATRLVESQEGGVCLFALGCAGNIVPIERSPWARRKVGLSVGSEALKVFQWIGMSEEASLKVAWKRVDLPLRDMPSVEEAQREVEDKRAALDQAKAEGMPVEELGKLVAEVGRVEHRLLLAKRAGGATALPTEVQVFRIGDIVVVGLPGEVFFEFGKTIKKRSGHEHTMVISLSNDYPGYVPTSEAYAQGGYEANSTLFAPGAGEQLAEEALEAIREC